MIQTPKKEMVEEHRSLIKVLKMGTKAQRLREAKKQAQELKKYVGA